MASRLRYPRRLDPDRAGSEWVWAIAGFVLVLALAVLQFGAGENGLLRGLSLGLAVALLLLWVARRRRDEHEKARRAIDDERLRIARELHDVVAHHVSANGAGHPDRQRRGDAAGGHGLIGMRERAVLFGGDLRAGPSPDGGWRVNATLPTTATSPTSGSAP